MPHEAKHDEADNAFYAQLDELLGLDAAGLRALALFLNLNKKSRARMTGATKEMERNARHLARAVDFFRPYFTEPEHYLATASQYLTLFKLAKLNREKATALFAKIRFDYPLYRVDEFVAEQNTRKKRKPSLAERCAQLVRAWRGMIGDLELGHGFRISANDLAAVPEVKRILEGKNAKT